jgi:hypothetical protein
MFYTKSTENLLPYQTAIDIRPLSDCRENRHDVNRKLTFPIEPNLLSRSVAEGWQNRTSSGRRFVIDQGSRLQSQVLDLVCKADRSDRCPFKKPCDDRGEDSSARLAVKKSRRHIPFGSELYILTDKDALFSDSIMLMLRAPYSRRAT